MNNFHLKLSVQCNEEPTLRQDTIGAIIIALQKHQPELQLKAVSIDALKEESDIRKSLNSNINFLKGRSKIIVKFLLDNPGMHSTGEIKEVINIEQPFRAAPILHSYLNNLVSRGYITKVSSGWYKIP